MGDLCSRARHMLPAWANEGREPTLAATAAAAVVESMLGSIEWLLVMVKSVVVVTDTDMARVLAPDASILGRSELADLLLGQEEDHTVELSVTSTGTTIWESIVMQSLYDRSNKQAISSTSSQSVIQAILRRASSLKVVLWKAVGDLYALKRSHPICNASVKKGYRMTLGLIQLWHQTYGDLCTHLVGGAAIPSAVTQSMFAFVSNHVNLAVLHFVGCIEEEEDQGMQSLSWTEELRLFWEPFRSLHHDMKRSSALSIARVSALEAGGYLTADLAENNAPDKEGVVACLPLGLWCHPVSAVSCRAGLVADPLASCPQYPAMVAQALYKACIVLYNEAQHHLLAYGDAGQVLPHLEACLTSLRRLQSTSASLSGLIIDTKTLDVASAWCRAQAYNSCAYFPVT